MSHLERAAEMRKLFGHRKESYAAWDQYEGNCFDWDMGDEDSYEENSEEFEEDENAFEDEADCFETEEGYWEEEYPEEEYSREEYSEQEYPAQDWTELEEGWYSEESEEKFAAGEEEFAEAEYFEDEETLWPERVQEDSKTREKQRGGSGALKKFWGRLLAGFRKMSVMDRIITGTTAAVLVLALITGSVYVSARMTEGQMQEFVSVGAQLKGINLIGEKGLLAVADAEQARLAAAGTVEEEKKEYQENEYGKAVTVALELISVQKDLKIKFTNKKTGKLVANVPFEVTVTDSDGEAAVWLDDDRDGIIYKKDIAPGIYQVALKALSHEKYADYTLLTDAQSVEVKKDISYKKIDVKNEIKKESEINAAKEDTRKNETVVESTLKDTVNWVESTQTSDTYTEVPKNSIPDPALLVSAGKYLRTAQTVMVSPASAELKPGESFTVTAQCPEVNFTNIVWGSSNPNAAKVEGNGASATVTALAASESAVLIFFNAEGTTVSGGNAVAGLTASCSVKIADGAGSVTIDQASVTLEAGAQKAAKASVSGFTAGKQLSYSAVSSRTDIAEASADGAGNVTIRGIAPGDAVVTVTVNYSGGNASTAATASIPVKVIPQAGPKTLTLDKTAATVYLTEPVTIHASIANAATQNAVTAESSDTEVATVAVNGRSVTITGVTPGSAAITVKYTESGEELTASCAVTVKAHPRDDRINRLKDAEGRLLYVQENGSYREALYADYYTADKFFVRGEVKYTGWQTLDGKVYFFDGAGNQVTGEQVIQGAKYNFASDGSLVMGSGTMGIDVSKWNGTIDWEAVKNSGVSYVIIRCGYRGSSQGGLIEDSCFERNIKGATAAGLKVGVYFFTQALDEVEAVEEASMVLELIKGYRISYPVFLDVESSGGRADKIDKAARTAVCRAFCETIQDAGYTAGIYANKIWLEKKIDAEELSAYKIWLAQYAAAPTYQGRYDLWQYKSTGRVSGIKGNVDLNVSYLGY